jgi:DNA-binding NarL/FixJ family response regulator
MSLGVLIAEDHALMRAGFRLILDAETDLSRSWARRRTVTKR